MVAADTRVIGLTVTEKGYGGDPASGRLSGTDADLANDPAVVSTIRRHLQDPVRNENSRLSS